MTNLTRTEDLKRLQNDLMESSRKMWLASLGVVSTVEAESVRVFDELVKRGKSVEARGRKQISQAKADLESTTDELAGKLDRRVSDVLKRMGVPSAAQVEELTKRVDRLSNKVDRLTAKPKRTTAKKTAGKAKAA